ncbi:putative geranylgeranyl diphosphate synthase [Aspergillus heterothallicus]
MEFEFSSVVDPANYKTYGLCDGYDVRCNDNAEAEDIGCLRCQEHWRKSIGPLGAFKGALGNPFNLISLVIPECRPERLEIVAFSNELAFLHDGRLYSIFQQGDAHNDDFKEAFNSAASTGSIEGSTSGKRAMQAYIAQEMMRIDKPRAIQTVKAWAKFVDYGGRQETTRWNSVEEYLEYRIEDIGLWFWYGLLSFAMALDIPEHEREPCHKLCRTAYLQILLVHDLASWEKEKLNAAALGKDVITNMVFVLMHVRGISEDEAKEECLQQAKSHAEGYLKIVEDYKKRDDVSLDSKKYVEAWLYTISGNTVWSFICPRYNISATFTDRQIEYMKNGVPGASSNGASNSCTNGTSHVAVNGNGHATNGHIQTDGIAGNEGLLSAVTLEHLKNVNFKLGDHDLAAKACDAPYVYINSLKGKQLRTKFIDMLNTWLPVCEDSLQTIKNVVQMLHNSSLMLDDIEDSSSLRRGRPATHCLYGTGQTINSANFIYVKVVQEALRLPNRQSLDVLMDELNNLHCGQGLDLYWRFNNRCPSIEDYIMMVDNKTGGLFRMICRLMEAESEAACSTSLSTLLTLTGRFFQIRDDYLSLTSADFQAKKGFCEDFDEGKFSLPLIHLLGNTPYPERITAALFNRPAGEKTVAYEVKTMILNEMEAVGTFDYVRQVLGGLHDDLLRLLDDVESEMGSNPTARLLIMSMAV